MTPSPPSAEPTDPLRALRGGGAVGGPKEMKDYEGIAVSKELERPIVPLENVVHWSIGRYRYYGYPAFDGTLQENHGDSHCLSLPHSSSR